ncbi:hypothetical protein [Nostoc sp.]|uniref:hypothetical protein n=1 Tax=Nostoc sp. TaxID=1180 RepID=UPI002FFAC33E
MRKTTIFTFTLLSSLAILPAVAQVNTTELGQVWTDFQSYSGEMQKYFQYNLSDTLKPLESESKLALDTDNNRELNIPNPVAAGKQIRGLLINPSYRYDPKSNRFENNSAVWANLVSNELNRVITRGIALGVLGKIGQDRTKAKLENIQTAIESVADVDNNDLDTKITDIANKAGSLSPSNTNGNIITAADVLLTQGIAALLTANHETLKIQKEQIKIVGESYAKSTQLEQSLQYSNLNLANISQQSEEANRARRVETSTEAARLLRATSQLDLFGRKSKKEDFKIKKSSLSDNF